MTRTILSGDGPWPRYLNVLLGAWLLVSDVVWRHGQTQSANTWICVLVIGFALWALWMPSMRWWNVLIGSWVVFFSLAFVHVSAATEWNNVILGVLIALVSLVPSRSLPDRRESTARLS